MNCGKSRFVDADHTCSRADTTVCRSSYKKQKLSHALHRCSVAALDDKEHAEKKVIFDLLIQI